MQDEKILSRKEKLIAARNSGLIFVAIPIAITSCLGLLFFKVIPFENNGGLLIKTVTMVWWAAVIGTAFCLYAYLTAMYSLFFKEPTKKD
jgi:hypothetical protein